jgi:hypothetical protein
MAMTWIGSSQSARRAYPPERMIVESPSGRAFSARKVSSCPAPSDEDDTAQSGSLIGDIIRESVRRTIVARAEADSA